VDLVLSRGRRLHPGRKRETPGAEKQKRKPAQPVRTVFGGHRGSTNESGEGIPISDRDWGGGQWGGAAAPLMRLQKGSLGGPHRGRIGPSAAECFAQDHSACAIRSWIGQRARLRVLGTGVRALK